MAQWWIFSIVLWNNSLFYPFLLYHTYFIPTLFEMLTFSLLTINLVMTLFSHSTIFLIYIIFYKYFSSKLYLRLNEVVSHSLIGWNDGAWLVLHKSFGCLSNIVLKYIRIILLSFLKNNFFKYINILLVYVWIVKYMMNRTHWSKYNYK